MDRREEGVLASSRDRYRGITVDTNRTEINVAEFPDLLASTSELHKIYNLKYLSNAFKFCS